MGESWIVCLFVCVYGFPESFVGAEKTWEHVPLSTQSLKRGFLRNPSLTSLAGRISTFRDPLFEHFFGSFVKKVVLHCKNKRFDGNLGQIQIRVSAKYGSDLQCN